MVFLWKIVRIVIIDLVLSGDNAIVIGMAAHRLDPGQRRKAILLGLTAALVLRILLTTAASFMLRIAGLHFVGGLLLLWIGFKLLKQEEESHDGIKSAAGMKEAVVTILIADFVMSLDNVIGVAGASSGSMELLIFGLIVSMGFLMFMGSVVASLINKLWWLAYVGSGVIAWTGAHMMFEDSMVHSRLQWMEGSTMHIAAAIMTALLLLSAHWYYRIWGQRGN